MNSLRLSKRCYDKAEFLRKVNLNRLVFAVEDAIFEAYDIEVARQKARLRSGKASPEVMEHLGPIIENEQKYRPYAMKFIEDAVKQANIKGVGQDEILAEQAKYKRIHEVQEQIRSENKIKKHHERLCKIEMLNKRINELEDEKKHVVNPKFASHEAFMNEIIQLNRRVEELERIKSESEESQRIMMDMLLKQKEIETVKLDESE